MKNDRFSQFDSLIDALNEDSLGAEDIRKLSPEEKQMFLVAKNLKGMASYDPIQAESFKKRLSERLLAVPDVARTPIPVAFESDIPSFSEKIRDFFIVPARKRTFAISFAVLLLVFSAVMTNIPNRRAPDTSTSRLIADLSGSVNLSIQNEMDLYVDFSSVEMDDLEMMWTNTSAASDPALIELLELSSSLDDFDPDSEDDFDNGILDLNNFSTL